MILFDAINCRGMEEIYHEHRQGQREKAENSIEASMGILEVKIVG